MFWESFKITGTAIAQIFIMGLIGYFLVKRQTLGESCLGAISHLALNVALPFMIFCRLMKDFNFALYPDWWIFPLLSIAVTLIGLGSGYIFSRFIHGQQHKMQFISLLGFQNSGYLPLPLIGALFAPERADVMFIYLFLFLLGFNLVTFSFGVYMLAAEKGERFDWAKLLNPPVVAVLLSFVFIALGWNKFFPDLIYKPLKMIGDCTLPLAMFVVGGNIAQISLKLQAVNKRAMALLILGKLILMPALGLWLVVKFNLPEVVGFIFFVQLLMPPAANLSVIIRHYKKEDLLISQGLFFGHIASIITIPLFLSLYFFLMMK